MSKNDFLEILRDYLNGTFSELEINDILRDYEEFFLNGELQGKSEEEIIRGLGSPKSIANELIDEMKGQTTSDAKSNSNIKINIEKEIKKIFKSAKSIGKKVGNKAKEFLDSNSVINGNISSSGLKFIITIITCMLSILVIPIAFTILGFLIFLIGLSVANFIGYLGAAIICGVSLPSGIFGFFLCITWTGFIILGWILYYLTYKALKYIVVKYISWVKTRKMYVRVKDQQEKSSNKENNKDIESIDGIDTEEIVVNSNVHEEKSNCGEVLEIENFDIENLEENKEDSKEGRYHDK